MKMIIKVIVYLSRVTLAVALFPSNVAPVVVVSARYTTFASSLLVALTVVPYTISIFTGQSQF